MDNKDNLSSAFQEKAVMQLNCFYCDHCICNHAMRAILLADNSMELFSTDLPSDGSVDQIGLGYRTGKCDCRIKDIACLRCGNVVGYHVIRPCTTCLRACNNGHLWMFYDCHVTCIAKSYSDVEIPILWGHITSAESRISTQLSNCEECLR